MGTTQAVYRETTLSVSDAYRWAAAAIAATVPGRPLTPEVSDFAFAGDGLLFGSFGPRDAEFGRLVVGLPRAFDDGCGVLIYAQPGFFQKKKLQEQLRQLARELDRTGVPDSGFQPGSPSQLPDAFAAWTEFIRD